MFLIGAVRKYQPVHVEVVQTEEMAGTSEGKRAPKIVALEEDQGEKEKEVKQDMAASNGVGSAEVANGEPSSLSPMLMSR